MALALSTIAFVLFGISPAKALTSSAPVPCESISAPELPGISVTSVSAVKRYHVPLNPDEYWPHGVIPIAGHPVLQNSSVSVCAVSVSYSHIGVDDDLTVLVYLPLDGWNGRFQAVGGGGFIAGFGEEGLGPAAFSGYAAANLYAPDVAEPGSGINPKILKPLTPATDFGFANEAEVNQGQWADFASRGLHEMAVVGKAVTESFYGRPPQYSYYTGCSTGGRQGYTFVQRYPHDFDGVLANAPGIFWNSVMFSFLWPMVPMMEANVFLTRCQIEAFDKGFVSECDMLDGVPDGVVNDPDSCPFEPRSMKLSEKIHQGIYTGTGRRLWFGYNYDTAMIIVNTTMSPNGTVIPGEPPIAGSWISYFLQGNPSFDIDSLTLGDVVELFAQSSMQWGGSMGTDIADITAFRDSGGKLLTWHGLSDENVPPNGTAYYRTLVEGIMGGNDLVNEWYRVFFAPGVGHCGSTDGHGPVPVDAFAALVEWVEVGIAPDTLPAVYVDGKGTQWTKNLCPFPKAARYDGLGDPTLATSYSCADSYMPK